MRYIHTILRKALSDAVRWGKLTRNVADQADPPRGVRAPEQKTWTAEELSAFLGHVRDDRLFALWRLKATTGMRRGEVLGLRWTDVDLEGAALSVAQTLVSNNYKVEFSTPKTAKSRRSISVDPITVSALRTHRKCQLEERMAWGPAYVENGLVFTREDGSPIHPDRLSKIFESHRRKAQLPKIRVHDLRHTYATLALRAGVHPKVVSERLGHSSIAITLDVYSHAVTGMQAEAALAVAHLLQ